MSEVHKHEQAAVSPSFILDLTETTQELGTSCSFLLCCLLCLCLLVPVCVASGVKRGSPTFAPGSCEKHSFIWTCVRGLVLYRCT